MEKPSFLTWKQWKAVLALEKWGGRRGPAAKELNIKTHSLVNMVSRIRRKIREARALDRKYGKVLKSQRARKKV